MLARLLARRFGALPDWAKQQLTAANEAQLEAWTDAVLDAGTLAEVLAKPPAKH